jgi:hypothetical protein
VEGWRILPSQPLTVLRDGDLLHITLLSDGLSRAVAAAELLAAARSPRMDPMRHSLATAETAAAPRITAVASHGADASSDSNSEEEEAEEEEEEEEKQEEEESSDDSESSSSGAEAAASDVPTTKPSPVAPNAHVTPARGGSGRHQPSGEFTLTKSMKRRLRRLRLRSAIRAGAQKVAAHSPAAPPSAAAAAAPAAPGGAGPAAKKGGAGRGDLPGSRRSGSGVAGRSGAAGHKDGRGHGAGHGTGGSDGAGEAAATAVHNEQAEAEEEEEEEEEEEDGVERRVDPSDGLRYSLRDFLIQYGGTAEWEAADPAGPADDDTAAAPPSKRPRRAVVADASDSATARRSAPSVRPAFRRPAHSG